MAATAATEPHRLFLARLLLMRVAAVVENTPEPMEPAVLVAVETQQVREPTALATRAAVAVALLAAHQRPLELAAMAALASSSSSTTSALPRSSPSSHRRIGLRQRVR
jgi:hypothetical protein